MSVHCFDCNKIFVNQSSLNKHLRVVHKINKISAKEYEGHVGIYKCLEGCNVSFKYNMDLRKHLQEKHEFHIEVEEKAFATYNEFEIWLKMEEKNNDIQYVKCTGRKQRENNKKVKIYFDCVRSGKVRVTPDYRRKRNTKKQGSCKINKFCTSQIIITINPNSEACLMKYFKNHYGHEHDIQHLRVKCNKENTALKLILGVSEGHSDITTDQKRDETETLKQEIEFTALQIIEKVKSTNHRTEDLQLILKNLKTAALSMENGSLHLTTPSTKEGVDMEIQETQSFFSSNKKQKKSLCNLKPNYNESKIIKELLTTSLYVSNDPRNDHLY